MGEIVALNDERESLSGWESVKDFMRCLSEKEIVYDELMAGEVHHFGDSKGHEVVYMVSIRKVPNLRSATRICSVNQRSRNSISSP